MSFCRLFQVLAQWNRTIMYARSSKTFGIPFRFTTDNTPILNQVSNRKELTVMKNFHLRAPFNETSSSQVTKGSLNK